MEQSFPGMLIRDGEWRSQAIQVRKNEQVVVENMERMDDQASEAVPTSPSMSSIPACICVRADAWERGVVGVGVHVWSVCVCHTSRFFYNLY